MIDNVFACVKNGIMTRSDVERDNSRPPIQFTSNAIYVLWQMHFGLQFLTITTISGLTVLKTSSNYRFNEVYCWHHVFMQVSELDIPLKRCLRYCKFRFQEFLYYLL